MKESYRHGNYSVYKDNVSTEFKTKEQLGLEDLDAIGYKALNLNYMRDNNIPQDSKRGKTIVNQIETMDQIIADIKLYPEMEKESKEINNILNRIPEELRDSTITRILANEKLARYNQQKSIENGLTEKFDIVNGMNINSGFIRDNENGVEVYRQFIMNREVSFIDDNGKEHYTESNIQLDKNELQEFCGQVMKNARNAELAKQSEQEETYFMRAETENALQKVATLKEFFDLPITSDMRKVYDNTSVDRYAVKTAKTKRIFEKYSQNLDMIEKSEHNISKIKSVLETLKNSDLKFKSEKAKQKLETRLNKKIQKQDKKLQKYKAKSAKIASKEGLSEYLDNAQLYENYIIADKALKTSQYEKLVDLHNDREDQKSRGNEEATFGIMTEEKAKEYEELRNRVWQIEMNKVAERGKIQALPEATEQKTYKNNTRSEFMAGLRENVNTQETAERHNQETLQHYKEQIQEDEGR